MYIDEYLTLHPEKVPKGVDLNKFALECEEYIDYCTDLVPYNDKHYVERVFDLCICANLEKYINANFNI